MTQDLKLPQSVDGIKSSRTISLVRIESTTNGRTDPNVGQRMLVFDAALILLIAGKDFITFFKLIFVPDKGCTCHGRPGLEFGAAAP